MLLYLIHSYCCKILTLSNFLYYYPYFIHYIFLTTDHILIFFILFLVSNLLYLLFFLLFAYLISQIIQNFYIVFNIHYNSLYNTIRIYIIYIIIYYNILFSCLPSIYNNFLLNHILFPSHSYHISLRSHYIYTLSSYLLFLIIFLIINSFLCFISILSFILSSYFLSIFPHSSLLCSKNIPRILLLSISHFLFSFFLPLFIILVFFYLYLQIFFYFYLQLWNLSMIYLPI